MVALTIIDILGLTFTVSEFVVLTAHVTLFLMLLRLAHVSFRAYRSDGEPLQRNLTVAFLFMIVGISGDDLAREVFGLGRLPTEALELVPLWIAVGLIYVTLFVDVPDPRR